MISQRVCSKNSSWMRITVLHRMYSSTRHVPGASIRYRSKVRTTKIYSLAACFLGALRKKPTRIRARMSSPTLTRALRQLNKQICTNCGKWSTHRAIIIVIAENDDHDDESRGVEQKCVDSLARLSLSLAQKT